MTLFGRNTAACVQTLFIVSTACLVAPCKTRAQTSKLYWVGSGGVWRANLDGTSAELIAAVNAVNLAVDPAAKKLYWTTWWGAGTFHRADLDGSNHEEVTIPGLSCRRLEWIPDDFEPKCGFDALAVDPGSKRVFLAGIFEGGGTLFRANPDGTDLVTVSSLIVAPSGLSLDPRRGWLYISGGMAFPPLGFRGLFVINATHVDSLPVRFAEASYVMIPRRISVDLVHQTIYWTESTRAAGYYSCRSAGLIRRADLGGGNVENVTDFYCSTFFAPSVAVAPRHGLLFWTQEDGIYRGDLDASNPQRILELNGWKVRDLAIWTPPGDFDADDDIDLADLVTFQACYTGPGGPLPNEPACREADLDFDGDVDLADLLAFQAHFTGSQ